MELGSMFQQHNTHGMLANILLDAIGFFEIVLV